MRADRARDRPPVTFIAWSEDDGRVFEIAEALGGEPRCFFDFGIVRRPLVPLRYAASAIRTVAYLIRRRPRAVIATNPPIFPALLALAYGRLAQAPVVLDSHPSAFMGGGSRLHRMQRVHAWMSRRAATTLVTVGSLEDVVRSWGARADVVHEAPPTWSVGAAPELGVRPRILYIGRFGGDEPIEELVEAAKLTPEVDLHITGDRRRCDPLLQAAAPDNVTFTGFLRGDAFSRAIEEANIVVVLTRLREAVNRAAYEVVYAKRPLVLSDSPALRSLFPYAVLVPNDPEGIAAGVRSAVERYEELADAAPLALAVQRERWECQLSALRSAIGIGSEE